MAAIKIKDGVYSVGALNPNMRIFDVIMRTDYGTSYNSFLIKSEKTALLETVHERFFGEYIENISSITDPTKIDYLIMNHNEPDHSGSLRKLLEKAPQLQVITTQAGALYLKNITNLPDLNIKAVRDGDTLDLGGGKTLKFITAPFLHWPDSMFTWLESDKIAFTCDFLGAHYCEPRMFDSLVSYPDSYRDCVLGYYNAIFGPFKPYVLKGLTKLDALDAEFVCPSHGPVLTKGVMLEEVKKDYLDWSTPATREHKYIPIFYCSAYGNTGRLARAMADGISETLPDAKVEVLDINANQFTALQAKVNSCDAFLVGTPTINRDAVAPVWQLVTAIDAINTKGRKCAAFGSFGWSGEGVPMITERLRSLKLDVFADGYTCRFVPSDDELSGARDYGKRFAEAMKG
jgi:flavorubredoxin